MRPLVQQPLIKFCPACPAWLPREAFYGTPSRTGDGLSSLCRWCTQDRVLLRRGQRRRGDAAVAVDTIEVVKCVPVTYKARLRSVERMVPALPVPPDWTRSRCSAHPQPDLWSSSSPAERRRAIFICHHCPVEQQCRAYSLSLPLTDKSVWGGLSPADRRELSRAQAAG
jgi:hypothetical protein